MSFDINTDIDRILATPLAEDAVLRPGAATEQELRCLFDEEFMAIAGGMATLGTAQVVALCKPGDVADAARGDAFLVLGRTFRVGRVRPDGSGWSLVELREESA